MEGCPHQAPSVGYDGRSAPGQVNTVRRICTPPADTGVGKKTAEAIAAELRPTFPAFTKEELLTDMEYGGTPWSRAVINVNVAFQELAKR